MRSIFAAWLITLLSLTSSSAVGQLSHVCHAEGAFCATEESRFSDSRFFAEFILSEAEGLRMTTGGPITFEGYWELVRNTRQAILQMEAEPEAAICARLEGLASQWEGITAVETSDKNVVKIDTSYLVAELRNDPPDLERLVKLLDVLLNAHEVYPQKIFSLQDVQPLKKILARPEFQWQEAQSLEMPNWLQELLQRFFDLMDRIGYGVRNVSYYGRVPLIVAAALLFVLSLFYISRSLSRSLVREAQLTAEGDDGDETLTSKRAMQRAQALSGQGDYRNAIRYLYLSSLLVLDEQGLLRYDRSRTNREYLRSIASKPELANPLRDVIDVFDRVWYGFESVDEETYQSYVKHVDDLREKKE